MRETIERWRGGLGGRRRLGACPTAVLAMLAVWTPLAAQQPGAKSALNNRARIGAQGLTALYGFGRDGGAGTPFRNWRERKWNLLDWSDAIDNSRWSKTSGVVVVETNIADPLGGTAADAISFAAGVNKYVMQSVPGAGGAGGSFTASVWLRLRSGTFADNSKARISIYGSAFASASTAYIGSALSGEWQRFSVTGQATTSGDVVTSIRTDDSEVTLEIFGFQANPGPAALEYERTEANQRLWNWGYRGRRLNLLPGTDLKTWGTVATPVVADAAMPDCYTVEDTSAASIAGVTSSTAIQRDTAYTLSARIRKDGVTTRFPELQLNFSGGTGRDNKVQVNTQTGATIARTGTPVVRVSDLGDGWLVRVTDNSGSNTTATAHAYAAVTNVWGSTATGATGTAEFGQIQVDAADGAAWERTPYPDARRGGSTATTTNDPDFAVENGVVAGYRFNGTDDYCLPDDPAAWNFGTGDFTVFTVFTTTSTAIGNANGVLYTKSTAASFSPGYALNVPNGAVRFVIGDGTNYTTETAGAGVNDGGYHFAAATVRRGTAVTVYVDGAEGAEQPSTFTTAVNNGYAPTIGALVTPSPNHPFLGTIAVVGAYERALSAGEVSRLRRTLRRELAGASGGAIQLP